MGRFACLALLVFAACKPVSRIDNDSRGTSSGGTGEFPLYEPRADQAPHLEKLKAAGGDVSKILRFTKASELMQLASGKKYKFVVGRDGKLAIAPLSADTPNNEYVHPVLGNGEPVRAAGGITVSHAAGSLSTVTIDQDSKTYCPTADGFRAAIASLRDLGVATDAIRIDNVTPKCLEKGDTGGAAAMAMANPDPAKPPEGSAPRYGALMVEVGYRYNMISKATKAKRFELAAFELHEMDELFEEDLPHAKIPSESVNGNLPAMADAFTKTNLPELKAALESKDAKQIEAAFAKMSAACNACHQASTHGFVEIPPEVGADIPKLSPL